MKYGGKLFVATRSFLLACALGFILVFSFVGISLAASTDEHVTQVGIGFIGEEKPTIQDYPVVLPNQVFSSTNAHSSLASTGWVPINFWIICFVLFMAGIVIWLRSFIRSTSFLHSRYL